MRLPPVLLIALSGACPAAAQLAVTSTEPALNAINVPPAATISVTFDQPVDRSTVTAASFRAFARWGGPVAGPVTFSQGDRTVTLTPAAPLMAGEGVMLILSHDLRAAGGGAALRQAGYTLTFTIATAPTGGGYCHRATLNDRSPGGAQTRIYGGLACDLNRDGWADLTMINEVSADLRVFLNRADGSGLFGPMLVPPAPIPFESSPNEPADFNGDGFVDVVATSNFTGEVSIARGNGDGTYAPAANILVGNFPRGVAIVDADGDGDHDILVALRDADSIALLRNNGNGTFAAPVLFPSGGDGPYGLVAADMNGDGLLDLVVGHSLSQTVTVLAGNGSGTFPLLSSRSIGGANWVVAAGDINGDGRMDIAAANSGSSNASVLRGNGDGTLQAATILPNAGHTVATDFADIDGDGDLDLIVSSFGAGRWYLYTNTGTGQFVPGPVFLAPGNPACSVFADFDRDGDADLALLDETTDYILLMSNIPGPACYANCDCSFSTPALNVADFTCYLQRFAAADPYANCDASTTAPVLNVADFTCFLQKFAAGCP